MQLTGSQALIKSLEMEGVDTIFGLPGGCILPVYDPLIDSSIRHILVRHEQGAGHMAEGYAHVTGRPGVAMVTSGPAATNIVTPLCDAYMDSIPLVVITGQVPYAVIGTDAFQEADTVGITMPVTKHNWLITDAQDIPRTIREAFHVATTGRPGPVLVDVPKDIANQMMHWEWPETVDLPGYKPNLKGHPKQIKDAAKLIGDAKRPVIYAGGGILKARAAEALRELAETTGIPVVTTLMARGAFPDSHELALGMPGMHGNYTAVTAMQKSDLLITLGARFDDRVTGKLAGFAPNAKVIHVDIDPAEIGKNRAVDVPIVGDCRDVIGKLHAELAKRQDEGEGLPDRSAWIDQLHAWQEKFPYKYDQQPDGALKPQYCVERLRAFADDDTILVSGVGQHQMYASQFWGFEKPRHWINSGGLGTMGFAVPAAMGAKVGQPNKRVVAIDGDGCFQMTAQELATSATENIPFVTAILNNGYLGMVRQWQEMFFDERYSGVWLDPNVPDYVKLAEAYGAVGLRVDSPGEVDAAIEKAYSVTDRSVVIDFRVDPSEMVFPMVPSGASNDDIIVGPEAITPTTDPAEAPIA